jgi:hypothetical protein
METKCRTCGKNVHSYSAEGHRLSKINTYFCSDKCKDDYHNAKRKAQRKLDGIMQALNELQTISNQYGHNPDFWFIDRGKEKLVDKIVTRDYQS